MAHGNLQKDFAGGTTPISEVLRLRKTKARSNQPKRKTVPRLCFSSERLRRAASSTTWWFLVVFLAPEGFS